MIVQIVYYAGKGLILSSEKMKRELIQMMMLQVCQLHFEQSSEQHKPSGYDIHGLPVVRSVAHALRAGAWRHKLRCSGQPGPWGSENNSKTRARLHHCRAQCRPLFYDKEMVEHTERGALFFFLCLWSAHCINSQSNSS